MIESIYGNKKHKATGTLRFFITRVNLLIVLKMISYENERIHLACRFFISHYNDFIKVGLKRR